MSHTSTEHSAHGGGHNIVSHIRDLLPLPRHAVFHVKLVVHQLQSVPFISGEFRIKWKFEDLQAVDSTGQPLGIGRALALKIDKRHIQGRGKGKGKQVADGERNGPRVHRHEPYASPSAEAASTPDTSPSSGRPSSSHSGQSSFNSNSKHSMFSSNSTSNFNSSSSSELEGMPSEGTGINYRSEARGYTSFSDLREFKVDFECQIDAAVQMTIEKDTFALLPSELKLTIMQRVIPGDPNAPLKPRLGHVSVNLAEYADAGPVTRTYLLRRSKVNAMLKMTIAMTQISGEENYVAPQLRKEEIKAGIAEFLNLSGTPLPTLSRFMTTDDPWLSNSLDLFLPKETDESMDKLGTQGQHTGNNSRGTPAMPEEHRAQPGRPQNAVDVPPPEERPRKRRRDKGNSRPATASGPGKATAQTQPTPDGPRKQDLHPTEALIEAIFNPYPSTSTAPSPFTYYAPPAAAAQNQDPAGSEETGTDGTSRGSFDSSQRTSASEHGQEGSSSGDGGDGKWWRW